MTQRLDEFPCLQELTRILQVRNVIGCHYNELSSVLDSDALGFGRRVLGVMNALTNGDVGVAEEWKLGRILGNCG